MANARVELQRVSVEDLAKPLQVKHLLSWRNVADCTARQWVTLEEFPEKQIATKGQTFCGVERWGLLQYALLLLRVDLLRFFILGDFQQIFFARC